MSKRCLCSFSITATSLFVCSLAATAKGPAFAAPAEVQVRRARDGKAEPTPGRCDLAGWDRMGTSMAASET